MDKTRDTSSSKIEKKSWYIKKDKKSKKFSQSNDSDGYIIQLKTKAPKFAVTQASISVQSSTGYEDLNEIVRSLIKQAGVVEEPIPFFEFIVNGELLPATCTLVDLLNTENVSPESQVQIEYFECQPVPKPHDNLEHDDWVSSVHCLDGLLLTGSYDNSVQIWNVERGQLAQGKEAHKITIDAHKAPVKCVKWISTADNTHKFITSSMDQKAYIWEYNLRENKATKMCECRGHTMWISSIATHQHKYFITASHDETIKIWDSEKKCDDGVDMAEVDGEPSGKKRKFEKMQTPKMTLAGHNRAVTGVEWMSNTKAISSSLDHSLIIWDVNQGLRDHTITSNMPFLALTYSESRNLAIASSQDRHIRFYDPRTDKNVASGRFSARPKQIVSLCMSAPFDNLFVSGCRDNHSYVWDIRSQKAPVHVLLGHDDQVLSVDWSDANFIVSGSSDCTSKIYSILHQGVDVQPL